MQKTFLRKFRSAEYFAEYFGTDEILIVNSSLISETNQSPQFDGSELK